jgi:hypothetical protein
MERARRAADRIPRDWVKGHAEARMAQALAKAGDVAGACALAAKIAPSERAMAYADIVAARAEAGDVAGAKAALQHTGGGLWREHALADLASVQARTGDAAGARDSAKSARQMMDPADGPPDSVARQYVKIAVAQARAGDAEGARASFADARTAADRYDESNWRDAGMKWLAMSGIAIGQAQAGEPDAARATAAAIKDDEQRAAACRAIAAAEARRGDLPALVKWIEGLGEPVVRAYAYAGAAEGLCGKDGTAAPGR